MISENNNGTVRYNFSCPSQLKLNDDIDKTKQATFDLSDIQPNNVINLKIPNSNGTFLVLGSNIVTGLVGL
jgi:hypothetical protein